jgi:hypothetical protein
MTTTHYDAGPTAGVAQAALAPHRTGRVASARVLRVRRPASGTSPARPADPFMRRPGLRGWGSRRLSGRPAVFVLASLIYVVSYLGLGVPAVAAGFGVVHGGGLASTARYYGAAVIALAALALFGLTKTRPGRTAQPAACPAEGIR